MVLESLSVELRGNKLWRRGLGQLTRPCSSSSRESRASGFHGHLDSSIYSHTILTRVYMTTNKNFKSYRLGL